MLREQWIFVSLLNSTTCQTTWLSKQKTEADKVSRCSESHELVVDGA